MNQAQGPVGEHVSPSLFRRANDRFEEAMQLELTLDNPNPDLWVYRAICDLNQGQFDQAFRYIDNAIKIRISTSDFANPSVEMYILKAKILWARGMMDLGNKEMIVAGTISSKHSEVNAFNEKIYSKTERLYKQAINFVAISEYNEAIKCAQGALLVTKYDTKLYILTSQVYRKMGDLDKAFEQIQLAERVYRNRGKRTDPNMDLPMNITQQTNLIFNDMAIKYAMEGEFSKAIALYNRIIDSEIKLNKGLPHIEYRYYLNRGDCYRGISKYEKAIEEYEKALTSKPQKQAVWELHTRISLSRYMISIDCFNNGNFMESDRHLSVCIELNPKVSEYFAARGKTRYYMSHFKEAYEDYKHAHHLNPDDLDVVEKLSQFDKQGAPDVEDDENLIKTVNRAKKGNEHIYIEDTPIYPQNAKPPPDHHLSKPSDTDTVYALLNYNKARQKGLPPVTKYQVSKLLKEKAVADAKQRKRMNVKSLRLPSMKKDMSLLTTSSQNILLGSYDAVQIAKSMRESGERDLKKIFTAKRSQNKSKLFGIINGVKEVVKLSKVTHAPSAAAAGLSASELKKKQKKEGLTLKNASTAQALIQVSKARTEKVLNNPDPRLVKGVKTWYGDPVLLGLEEKSIDNGAKSGPKGKKRKTLVIKRSHTAPQLIDPTSNNWKEGKPVNPKQLYYLPTSMGISMHKPGNVVSSGDSAAQSEEMSSIASKFGNNLAHVQDEAIADGWDKDYDNDISDDRSSGSDTSTSSSETQSTDNDDEDDYFA